MPGFEGSWKVLTKAGGEPEGRETVVALRGHIKATAGPQTGRYNAKICIYILKLF